jgi:hypothetical protein
MSLSTHWEWRGFGDVTTKFRRRFDTLSAFYAGEPQRLVDEYLWIPNVDINLKFRQGTLWQDGLKFKRLADKRGEFECWHESLSEVFPFPLGAQAWYLLLKEMRMESTIPPANADRDDAVRFLKSLDPRIHTVVVRKERRSMRWGPNGGVKVELARIFSPTETTSVGLESDVVALLDQAIEELQIDDEPLEPMNYLEYIAATQTDPDIPPPPSAR